MLIKNGTVLVLGNDDRVIEGGAVYFDGDTIVEVGPSSQLVAKYPQAEALDATGKVIMPGNVCAHTHFYGAFARGMAIPGAPPANFMAVLKQLWWKLDRALTLADCRASAQVALIDAIRHGTTTLIDHHASPYAIAGSLDVIGEAIVAAGVRGALCYEVSDRNGMAGSRAGIAENVRWIKKVQALRSAQAPEGEQLGAAFGLHASFTISNETMAACQEAVAGLEAGFHIHLAEDEADEQDSLQKYNLRVAERLKRLGVLGPRTLVAHCVHVDAVEIDILRQTGALVTHQPRSNMNNGVGVAPVETMLRRGVTVGLGNDGFSNNMFTEMAACYLLHKQDQGDPRAMGGDAVARMAYRNNARIAATFFPKPVGTLAPGAYADIILLDYHPYTDLTEGNYPWHMIFGMDGSYVSDTICGGRLLMKDRVLLTLDEAAIAQQAQRLAGQVWERVVELDG